MVMEVMEVEEVEEMRWGNVQFSDSAWKLFRSCSWLADGDLEMTPGGLRQPRQNAREGRNWAGSIKRAERVRI